MPKIKAKRNKKATLRSGIGFDKTLLAVIAAVVIATGGYLFFTGSHASGPIATPAASRPCNSPNMYAMADFGSQASNNAKWDVFPSFCTHKGSIQVRVWLQTYDSKTAQPCPADAHAKYEVNIIDPGTGKAPKGSRGHINAIADNSWTGSTLSGYDQMTYDQGIYKGGQYTYEVTMKTRGLVKKPGHLDACGNGTYVAGKVYVNTTFDKDGNGQ